MYQLFTKSVADANSCSAVEFRSLTSGRKKLLILATFVLSSVFVFAQDIIVTKKSKHIDAQVLEVNINDIRYKDWSNQDGPIYTILKSDIVSIVYQNGKVETFDNSTQQSQSNNNQSQSYGGDLPQSMTLSKFNSMNDDEQDKYFQKHVGGDIYDTFHSGVNLRRTGKGLLTSGLILCGVGVGFIVGGIVYYENNYYYDDGYYYSHDNTGDILIGVGAGLLSVGETLVIVSIPLNAVGGAKKRSAQNEYINTYLKGTAMYNKPELNFGFSKSGIGFTLNF
jgi:hypothetical protein